MRVIMTDNNKDNIVDSEQQAHIPESPVSQQSESNAKEKGNKLALYVGILAIFLIIIIFLAGGYAHKQNTSLVNTQQTQLNKLTDQLAIQKKQQDEEAQQLQLLQSNFDAKVKNVQLLLQESKNQDKIYTTDIQALQRSLAEKNVRHPNDWILAEVEYLVTLAGRKIWLERDINTAIALLLAADQRVAEMNDASLTSLRGALLQDINTLEALPKRDPDGIILALSNLERRIDKLVITSMALPDAMNNEETELSSDINDWQENLGKSWTTFVENFIVINKRDTKIEALLSPQQSWYLRESLRNDLAKAEFSIYREQQDIYDLALQSASHLLKTYYDLNNHHTNQFYKFITDLSERKISISYPDQLKSAPLLSDIIKKRVKKSLASSRIKEGS